MFAVGHYQIEEVSFHPYTAKFDYWLEGKARLSRSELRGYLLFNDARPKPIAAAAMSTRQTDGLPPLFTDHQFEALGVPRNAAPASPISAYFDLGICGPYRTDHGARAQYCGMFATPTLRNVATRHVFFHNGIYRTLQQVTDFYNFATLSRRRSIRAARMDRNQNITTCRRAIAAISM